MVLCFKLYFIKDATICTTAAATVRQMVSVIFERVVTEDSKGLGKFCSWSILRNNNLLVFRLLFFLKVECLFSSKGEKVHQHNGEKTSVKKVKTSDGGQNFYSCATKNFSIWCSYELSETLL